MQQDVAIFIDRKKKKKRKGELTEGKRVINIDVYILPEQAHIYTYNINIHVPSSKVILSLKMNDKC